MTNALELALATAARAENGAKTRARAAMIKAARMGKHSLRS
jgi:hypothetical protein